MIERYELIARGEGQYPIASMCQWFSVARSGYYAWHNRFRFATAIRGEDLAMMVKDVFDDSYEYRRIQSRTKVTSIVPADDHG